MRIPVLTVLLLVLPGCMSVPSGKLMPWNWFHGNEAKAVERATGRLDDAKALAYVKAGEDSHKAQEALKLAESSLPVEVAKGFNDDAVALLDQANGAPQVADVNKWKKQVSELTSANAEIRAKAEKELGKERSRSESLSSKIADLTADLEKKNKALPEALLRETETANKYRNLKYGFISLCVVAFIGYAGMIYLKYQFGGIPQALGGALSIMRAKHPNHAELITELLDTALNRHEQDAIAKHTI